MQGKHSGATQRVPINPRRDSGEDLWDCGRSEDLGGETSWFAGRIVVNVMPSGQMVVSIAEVVAVVAIEGGELYGAMTSPAFFARDFPVDVFSHPNLLPMTNPGSAPLRRSSLPWPWAL